MGPQMQLRMRSSSGPTTCRSPLGVARDARARGLWKLVSVNQVLPLVRGLSAAAMAGGEDGASRAMSRQLTMHRANATPPNAVFLKVTWFSRFIVGPV